MNRILILILIVFTLYTLNKRLKARTLVVASDGRFYRVLPGPKAVASAELLASVRYDLVSVIGAALSDVSAPLSVIDNIKRVYPSPDTDELVLLELGADTGQVAYTLNKTEGIHLCLIGDIKSGTLADRAAVTWVALHELAHSLMVGYLPQQAGVTQHNQEFYKLDQYLVKLAMTHGVISMNMGGKPHCGIRLYDSVSEQIR